MANKRILPKKAEYTLIVKNLRNIGFSVGKPNINHDRPR
jgi:hypothetical protein